jgi:hypothetical protein
MTTHPDWQPIETAPRQPRDPSFIVLGPPIILGFAPDEEGVTLDSCEGYWRPELSDHRGKFSAGWVSTLDPHVEPPYLHPTHWARLPSPPAAGGQS